MSDKYDSVMLPANSKIGIIGGGQLGRMLALAAAEYGYHVHIFSDVNNCPASQVSDRTIIGDYKDKDAMRAFAAACDVITYEFENIPVNSVEDIAQDAQVYPSANVLRVAQDRLEEKNLFKQLGLPIGAYSQIDSLDDLRAALENTQMPKVLKTRRMGYDGKGQFLIKNSDQVSQAWEEIGEKPAILEDFVPFDFEFSVIAARGKDGLVEIWPIAQNEHKNHILSQSVIPANRVSTSMMQAAQNAATKIMNKLDYTGVFALEIFAIEKNDAILLNEIAPRVHNSGHWTQNGANISQFHQHIRCITGMPLIKPILYHPTIMYNLIGDYQAELSQFKHNPNAHIHLYGKAQARPGRKMGHVNVVSPMLK